MNFDDSSPSVRGAVAAASVLGALVALSASSWAAPPPASPPAATAPDYSDRPQTCEGCHELAVDDFVELDDGTRVSVHIDPAVHGRSVHGVDGAELTCQDCHRRVRRYPHEPVAYADEREYRARMSKVCYRCHFKFATQYLDSNHFAKLRKERSNLYVEGFIALLEAEDETALAEVEAMDTGTDKHAPVCVDCHDSHDVQKANTPKRRISQVCKSCHQDVEETYAKSVHGRSLSEGVDDVPVCTDCHSSHRITKAKTSKFHAGAYEICADCHGDDERMKPYELSTEVLDTYLDDFHGSSNLLSLATGKLPTDPVATCADCHGYHDVQSFDREAGEAAVRARVSEMCANCHEGATESFADAWLSHSAPSFSHHPLVWAVMWIYQIAIPLMVVGLLLHIAMHLLRAALRPKEQGELS